MIDYYRSMSILVEDSDKLYQDLLRYVFDTSSFTVTMYPHARKYSRKLWFSWPEFFANNYEFYNDYTVSQSAVLTLINKGHLTPTLVTDGYYENEIRNISPNQFVAEIVLGVHDLFATMVTFKVKL